jgi:S-adenosylmethionine synthetase
VACETLVAPGVVVLAGEITSRAQGDVRAALPRIGYDDPALRFAAADVAITIRLGVQSAEIGAGVDVSLEQGSGTATDAFDVMVGHDDTAARTGEGEASATAVVVAVIATIDRRRASATRSTYAYLSAENHGT